MSKSVKMNKCIRKVSCFSPFAIDDLHIVRKSNRSFDRSFGTSRQTLFFGVRRVLLYSWGIFIIFLYIIFLAL